MKGPTPSVFGPGFPFPEESYLGRYPDVRKAVAAGLCPSGDFHYRNYGFGGGRGVPGGASFYVISP